MVHPRCWRGPCCSSFYFSALRFLLLFCLCLVHPMLPDSLDCPFLTATSVFSKVHFLLFLILTGPLHFLGVTFTAIIISWSVKLAAMGKYLELLSVVLDIVGQTDISGQTSNNLPHRPIDHKVTNTPFYIAQELFFLWFWWYICIYMLLFLNNLYPVNCAVYLVRVKIYNKINKTFTL